MRTESFFPPAPRPERPFRAPAAGWRILPISGTFTLVYEDRTGAWSSRTLDARELKLGPGRTLLGGIDRARGLYRGFRVDRIRRLTDHATGERFETGILDRLFALAKPRRTHAQATPPALAAA
jgi:hypothetical protein